MIEALLPDPRRPGSTRIIVAGRPAWTVPADAVATLALVVGQAIRGDLTEQLDQAADEEGAFRAGLRALERRAHAERELATKLQRRGHPPRAIGAAIARLRRLELLDDVAFARQFIAGRTERGRGPIRLRRDLALLGVTREIVDPLLAALAQESGDPLARARELIVRRARSMASIAVDVRRRRLVAFLARRGYRGDDAIRLVNEVLRSAA
ncbi:MAG TPA: regulatory protein RecX [Gemmatimonadales bacterium]|jgi:regulatory protein